MRGSLAFADRRAQTANRVMPAFSARIAIASPYDNAGQAHRPVLCSVAVPCSFEDPLNTSCRPPSKRLIRGDSPKSEDTTPAHRTGEMPARVRNAARNDAGAQVSPLDAGRNPVLSYNDFGCHQSADTLSVVAASNRMAYRSDTGGWQADLRNEDHFFIRATRKETT